MTTRRSFLSAFAATAAMPAFSAPLGDCRLKVGIVSDTHLSPPEVHNSQGAINMFKRVITFFRDQKVDAIMIAGDLTNGGRAAELQKTADCWKEVFGSIDAGPVKVFVTGNHEHNYAKDAPKVWQEIFGEPWSPFFIKEVKGYSFVGAHWAAWRNEKAFRAFLDANRAKLSGGKPFFFAQHAHPQNTCYGTWTWHQADGGPTHKVLADWPNAVAFSGHTHYSITDQRSVWQGAFTSLGTASLRWLSLPSGRENGKGFKSIGHRMSDVASDYGGAQGMLMNVYDDYMVFERWDFSRQEKLGDDWKVPVLRGKNDPRTYSFASRTEKSSAPEFPEGTELKFKLHKGRNPKKEPEDQIILTFPTAASPDDLSRVMDYEVCAELYSADVVLPWRMKRVYQTGFTRNPRHVTPTQSCIFGIGELPPPPFRFRVTPRNSFGKCGKSLFLYQRKPFIEDPSTKGKK